MIEWPKPLPARPLAVLLCALLAACGKPAPQQDSLPRELHLYNWSSYVNPAVLDKFRQETGIAVVEATYPSPEVMETTLLAGHSQYDVVITSDIPLEGLGKVGVFRPLDRARLKNWSNLDTAVMAQLEAVDHGNRLAVPYLWGLTGLALNTTTLKKYAPQAPIDSWAVMFDPRFARQVAGCGISVVDSSEDVFDTMLLYLGKDPNSRVIDDLQQASDHLVQVRGSIVKISSDGQINDLASGESCAELTWTSDVVQAKRQARESGNRSDFTFVIPREGAMIYIDAIAITADAPHPDDALAFIDFLMRPDIAALNANFVGGATPNRAAMPLIDPELRNDPAVYPPETVIASLKQFHRRPPEIARTTTREWTRFRTGN